MSSERVKKAARRFCAGNGTFNSKRLLVPAHQIIDAGCSVPTSSRLHTGSSLASTSKPRLSHHPGSPGASSRFHPPDVGYLGGSLDGIPWREWFKV
jgi:hypothetical protein